MIRIALVGAGGFVGTRLVERAWLGNEFEMVPIVRSPRGFVRISKYGRPCAYADAGDTPGLKRVVAGCDGVLNLTMGDNDRMSSDALSILRACEEAAVGTFLHVSSAEVFGRAVDAGLDDDSTPPPHWMEYARKKADAEAELRRAAASSSVRVVTVRPGLIWGPRSPWVAGPVTDLMEGTCVLFGGGDGIANLIHVDNLAEVLVEIISNPTVPSGFYNIADRECVRWKDYLEALAWAAGIPNPEFHRLPFDAYREGWVSKLLGIKDVRFLRRIKRGMPSQTKWHLRAAIMRGLDAFRSPLPVDARKGPNVTKSMWWLQGTKHKLPTAKIEGALPSLSLIDFKEGMRRTEAWMRFAGFHV